MKIEQNDYVLSDEELSVALGNLGQKPNALGIKSAAMFSERDKGSPPEIAGDLDASNRAKFIQALSVLTVPAKTARFHYTVADESISRSDLAWPFGKDGTIMVLIHSGDQKRISLRSEMDLTLLTERLLAADPSLRDEKFALELSTVAILVFLAITEHHRLSRHHSMMNHTEPDYVFSLSDVEARIAEAETEDFRSSFLFFTKIMPGSVAMMLTRDDITRALKELRIHDLIEPLDGDVKGNIYEMTKMGLWLVDGIVHEVSKVALGIAAFREDGQIGYEALLLVRSSFNLFLFDLVGKKGAIACLSGNTLRHFLSGMLTSPRLAKPQSVEEAPPSEEPPSALKCGNCGAGLSEGSSFCDECGQPIQTPKAKESQQLFCDQCGKPIAQEGAFCEYCGAQQS